METKIFVIAFPTMETVAEKISSILDDAFNCKPKKTECKRTKCYDTPKRKVWEDLTPPEFKVRNEFGNAPIPEWGIGGKPADDNLRFGYGLEADEPMYQDFDNDYEFLEARKAFDNFVDAGERCRELGLEKTNNAPITKCNAVRKPIGCPPPMNRELIGESQFPWWEIDMDWDF